MPLQRLKARLGLGLDEKAGSSPPLRGGSE